MLDIVHEKSGHLGYRKVEKIIKRRFTWPLLSVDVRKHCTSCESCQKANKSGPRRVNDLQRFMGTVNYYRRFVPGYCNYSAKLSPTTKPRAPGKVQWTGEMLEALIHCVVH